MVAPLKMPALLPMLRAAGKTVVMSHVNPDGDGVAAMLALVRGLRLARCDAWAMSPSPVPQIYRFLPGWEQVIVYSAESQEGGDASGARRILSLADAIVCLDCSDTTRLGHLYAHHVEKFGATVVVNIDHHTGNSLFGTYNLVDPAAAAVCEQMAVLMEEEDLPMTEEIASVLLVGIVTDTLGFRTSSTSARTLRVAASLMDRGASISRISERVFNTRSPSALRLWGQVLSRIQVEDGLVWADITREMLDECDARPEDADSLVDFIAGVPGMSGAFLFSEQDGSVRVSMRTSGNLDAAALARAFGGGGHPRAAGCTIDGPVSQARTLLVREARRRLGMVANGGEEQLRNGG